MGKKQSGHPSDNFSSVLAGAEYGLRSGKDFLTALALAYAVEIKLLGWIPVEEKSFDHRVHLAYSMAAGISRALNLDEKEIANARAISGTAFQGLVTSRSGYLTNWKGLASSMVALGVTNAEVHSQSAIEGMLELRNEYRFSAADVEKIDITIFKQAFNIIGEGEEAGNKHNVQSKEQADHSLLYIMAVAILDGEVTPRQYEIERIRRDGVQDLLQKAHVQTQVHVGKKVFEAMEK